jgi:hypothetical protein
MELVIHNECLTGLENRDYGRGDPLRWPRDTLFQLKLALTSPAGCGRLVGIVRLRTETTEFSFWFFKECLKSSMMPVIFGVELKKQIWNLYRDMQSAVSKHESRL